MTVRSIKTPVLILLLAYMEISKNLKIEYFRCTVTSRRTVTGHWILGLYTNGAVETPHSAEFMSSESTETLCSDSVPA